jgi:hypothetical protein
VTDTERLNWVIGQSILNARQYKGEPIALIVTEEAVRKCYGVWTDKYKEDVRFAIDAAIDKERRKSSDRSNRRRRGD